MTNARFEREVEWNMRPALSIGKAAGGLAPLMPPHGDMDEIQTDPELHDLVVALMTRIGMIMEDASPVALDAAVEGVGARVLIVADACSKIEALTAAVGALIGG